METPAFKVVSQTPQTVRNPQGQVVPGYRVTAQLASGSTFYVDVTTANYNAEFVRQALTAQAAEVDAIDRLGA